MASSCSRSVLSPWLSQKQIFSNAVSSLKPWLIGEDRFVPAGDSLCCHCRRGNEMQPALPCETVLSAGESAELMHQGTVIRRRVFIASISNKRTRMASLLERPSLVMSPGVISSGTPM